MCLRVYHVMLLRAFITTHLTHEGKDAYLLCTPNFTIHLEKWLCCAHTPSDQVQDSSGKTIVAVLLTLWEGKLNIFKTDFTSLTIWRVGLTF